MKSSNGTKFRIWVNEKLKDYNMNMECFKNNGYDSYFDELLDKIRDIKSNEKFFYVIEITKTVCEQSKFTIEDHFSHLGKMVNISSKASRNIVDYKLSRYACYLIVQNSDIRKEVIDLGEIKNNEMIMATSIGVHVNYKKY